MDVDNLFETKYAKSKAQTMSGNLNGKDTDQISEQRSLDIKTRYPSTVYIIQSLFIIIIICVIFAIKKYCKQKV